jgi:hypothetical protein
MNVIPYLGDLTDAYILARFYSNRITGTNMMVVHNLENSVHNLEVALMIDFFKSKLFLLS